MAILRIELQGPVSEWGKNMAHTVSDSHTELNLSPETRDITQTMWSTVPTAFEDSDTTGNNFTSIFR